jgi:hypothetical protein
MSTENIEKNKIIAYQSLRLGNAKPLLRSCRTLRRTGLLRPGSSEARFEAEVLKDTKQLLYDWRRKRQRLRGATSF